MSGLSAGLCMSERPFRERALNQYGKALSFATVLGGYELQTFSIVRVITPKVFVRGEVSNALFEGNSSAIQRVMMKGRELMLRHSVPFEVADRKSVV